MNTVEEWLRRWAPETLPPDPLSFRGSQDLLDLHFPEEKK